MVWGDDLMGGERACTCWTARDYNVEYSSLVSRLINLHSFSLSLSLPTCALFICYLHSPLLILYNIFTQSFI